ncbi:MAG: hypothetical protein QOJ64_1253 [Acidobacteriota bacterium]|jgi:hypothetical protein|nr:hypothetical protein [Acidobacteriota bacterium]
MKTKVLLVTLLAVIAVIGTACGQATSDGSQRPPRVERTQTSSSQVPAYQTAVSAGALRPTLAPERFIGPTQDAYRVAREIPETIAQLPCYCHCDKSIGHKSLHSCFEDTHASQCTICVSEALMAYDLQKNGMTPAQIRDRIVTLYSRAE